MSDKNLDQLFQQRFEDYQVEPSKSVWAKIDAQIHQPNRRHKRLSYFWSAAASLLIIIGAAWWFNQPVEIIKLQGKGKSETAENVDVTPEMNAPGRLLQEPVPATAPKSEKPAGLSDKAVLAFREIEEGNDQQVPAGNIKHLQEVEPVKNQAPQAIVAQPKIEEELPAVAIAQANPDEALADAAIAGNTEVSATSKRKAKGLGGLVNFVVAQVDHRENKIIEFKEGEEGTEIAEINLGLVKFKSRNR